MARSHRRRSLRRMFHLDTVVSNVKMREKKELTNGPNDARRVVWARSHHCRFLCRMFHLDTVVSNVKMREKKKELTNGPNDASCVVWARSRCHGGWW